jgi:type II secretory pathway component PulC
MMRYKLTALLTAVFFLFLAACDKPPRKTVHPPNEEALKINSESPRHLEKEEMQSLLNQLELKNPFSPRHFADQIIETKKEIELEGIMWDNEKPFAVIDGAVVAEGEFIDGKRVVRINNESVILDNQGREEILRIKLKWE